jgi:N-acylneuraminate cytidylyltransferase/CMP-N,N'-diacetyllegionaminic acid synthase
MKRICTICARGGSKGVPNKNIRELAGKPLLAHSIIQAQNSGLFDVIAVSSDSKKILEVAKRWGVDCLVERPFSFATDNAPKIPAIRHCVEKIEELAGVLFDVIVDLDATSPLRSVEDIRACVKLLEQKKVSNVITASLARRSPYFNLVQIKKGMIQPVKFFKKPLVRRQDSPQCFDMNASIYAWNRRTLFNSDTVFNKDTLLYLMPEERSIDIDSKFDFMIVDFLMRKNNRKKGEIK